MRSRTLSGRSASVANRGLCIEAGLTGVALAKAGVELVVLFGKIAFRVLFWIVLVVI